MKVAVVLLCFVVFPASSLYSTDISELEAKAKQGDTSAQVELARACLHGQAVPENPEKAFALFQKAAASGNVEAKAALGYLYLTGKGTKIDESKGLELLHEAAKEGSQKAAYNLAQFLINKDPGQSKVAVELMSKAAQAGMTEAQLVLAEWYYFGKAGIPQDFQKAYPLYLSAAEKGNPVAQNAVGAMLYDGQGVPVDQKRAVEYYMRAAKQGNAKAQVNIGHEYLVGEQLGQNKIEGLKWLMRANAQKEITARNSLKDLLRGCSEGEINLALEETGLEKASAIDLTYEIFPPGPGSRQTP